MVDELFFVSISFLLLENDFIERVLKHGRLLLLF
jgi:hypothetical protein